MSESIDESSYESLLYDINERFVNLKSTTGISKKDFLDMPKWYRKSKDHRFDRHFSDQEKLLTGGTCVWGQIVQANAQLFQKGKQDTPAAVIYSEDPSAKENPEILYNAAQALYSMKGQEVGDPALQEFADLLANEMDAPLRMPIPVTLTEGIQCYYTSILVARNHLPRRVIGSMLFPLVIHPTETDATMILPHRFWPEFFVNIYNEYTQIDPESEDESFTKKDMFYLAIVLIWFVGMGFIIHHYWFSINSTMFLQYPEVPKAAHLTEKVELEIVRGQAKNIFLFHFQPGTYELVLENKRGEFYLAPPKGFYTKQTARNMGLQVGGIYLPRGESDVVYVWQRILKNKDRSFESPQKSRVLSDEFDQPERELFLDPNWYESNWISVMRRPFIEPDVTIPRDKFQFE